METIDLRETLIPFSLLRISNRFKQMKRGEVIEIIGADAAIAMDLRHILAGAAFELRCAPRGSVSRNRPRLRLIKK
jgi:TusA-related sulfurtransferase